MSNDNLALLAAAAYGNFTDLRNKDSINNALTNGEFTEKQAEQFTNTYEIITHQPNTSSGYSGTIVRNRETQELFVLHRGTEIMSSRDLIQDGILALNGLPYAQLADAKRFVDNAIKSGIIVRLFDYKL